MVDINRQAKVHNGKVTDGGHKEYKITKGFVMTVLAGLFLALTGCQQPPSSSQDQAVRSEPAEQTFTETDREELESHRSKIHRVVYLAQPQKAATIRQMVQSHQGLITYYGERSGIVVAELKGENALSIEREVLKEQNPVLTKVSLDQFYKMTFEDEKYNPATEERNNPDSIVINQQPNNHQLPVEEMGLAAFRDHLKAEYGVVPNGDSVKIAVLDTGLDLAHKTVFQERITVSYDMTREGWIEIVPAEIGPDSSRLAITDSHNEFQVELSEELKNGEAYYFGKIKEESYRAKGDIGDLTQDGDMDDEIPVLVVAKDSDFLIALDINNDKSFVDETIIRDYEQSQDTIAVDANRKGIVRLNVNLIRESNGKLAQREDGSIFINVAGFDSGRHGTHVAGIAAGDFQAGMFQGNFQGAAPQAQLMGIKVLSSKGGNIADIIMGLDLAGKKGADVINLSLGSVPNPVDGQDMLSLACDRIVRTYNSVVVSSASNSGPGISTVGSPAAARRVLAIGATVTGETWRRAYNYNFPNKGHFLWSFSSVGPLSNGGGKPTLVAPGSALSSVPLARNPGKKFAKTGYDLYQGTSMSAPAAAGAIALLLDGINKIQSEEDVQSIAKDPLSIQWALVEGAKNLNEINQDNPNVAKYQRFEQGAGLLQLLPTFEALKKRKAEESIEYSVTSDSLQSYYDSDEATGIFATQPLPAEFTINVAKRPYDIATPEEANFYRELEVSSDAPWLTVMNSQAAVTGINTTEIRLKSDREFLHQAAPGTYEAQITARNAENGQLEWTFNVVYLKPIELTHLAEGDRKEIPGIALNPGELRRYYFFIDHDRSHFLFRLRTAHLDNNQQLHKNQYRMIVSDPKNRKVFQTQSYLNSDKTESEFTVTSPLPGIWEVIVYRSPNGEGDVPVSLEAKGSTITATPAVYQADISEVPFAAKFETELQNFGEPIEPVLVGELSTLRKIQERVALTHQQTVNIPVKIPANINKLKIETFEVQGQPLADIDLLLLDTQGNPVADSSDGTSHERVEVDVEEGQEYVLRVHAYQLSQPMGFVDIYWDFGLITAEHINLAYDTSAVDWMRKRHVKAEILVHYLKPEVIFAIDSWVDGPLLINGGIQVFDREISRSQLLHEIPVNLRWRASQIISE